MAGLPRAVTKYWCGPFEQVRRRHPLQTGDTWSRRSVANAPPAGGRAVRPGDRHLVVVGGAAARILLANSSADMATATSLSVSIQSFPGFKYGLPIDSDLVTDVRFLPNRIGSPSCAEQNRTDADCATTS